MVLRCDDLVWVGFVGRPGYGNAAEVADGGVEIYSVLRLGEILALHAESEEVVSHRRLPH
jgi:hypothetical protein